MASRFVRPGDPQVSLEEELAGPFDTEVRDFGRKLRELQTKPRSKSTLLPTVESNDPALAGALFRLALFESAEHHRLVAAGYRRNGVNDFAHRHYQSALRLEPCDSRALEGLAQIWRDWGLPEVALGDAHRAVHCAPDSASAHNTLGTIFQALGQTGNARRAFERAVDLDGRAAYGLNNLCYLALQQGDDVGAQRLCERALSVNPKLSVARSNLARAHAMRGDLAGAERHLLADPDRSAGLYNLGMLRMALGDYGAAAEAFESAARERASNGDARRRAAQARAKAAAERES